MITDLLNSSPLSSARINGYSTPHIIYSVFPSAWFSADLAGLRYDKEKMAARMKEVVEGFPAKGALLLNEEIQDGPFELRSMLTDAGPRYTTREAALATAGRHRADLIQDGRRYYIDHLESYVARKRRNMMIHFKRCMAELGAGDFRPKRNSTNQRLNHTLTSLKRELVELIVSDNGLAEIDICNSQFAVHAYWLRLAGLDGHEDVARYCDLCERGTLYEELMAMFSVARPVAKRMMMEIAFPSEKFSSASKRTFREVFPNVVDQIDRYKATEHNGVVDSAVFSNTLATIEAELMVDRVYARLKEAGLFGFTRHDSLVVRHSDLGQAMGIVRTEFGQVGFKCMLDVDGGRVRIG